MDLVRGSNMVEKSVKNSENIKCSLSNGEDERASRCDSGRDERGTS